MTIRTVRNLRRVSQLVFFLIFCWLIIMTDFDADFDPAVSTDIRLPYPVSIALELDPLVAISTLLANGTVYKGLLWSLVILIPTIFFGRFFCGWVCPLGSLNHWVSEIKSERLARKGARKIESNRYKKYQRIKYYILFLFIGSSVVGVLQVGLLDPMSLLARSVGTVILPMIHTGAAGAVSWIKSLGIGPVSTVAQSMYDLVSGLLLPFRQVHFHTILTIATVFLGILVMNRVFTRFWCRGLCPLGALLGIFSRFSLLGLKKNESECDNCQLCAVSCQGADNPEVGQPWRKSECHLCLNCQADCPRPALKFKLFPDQEDTRTNPAGTEKVDMSRRKAVASLLGGLSLFPLFRSGDSFQINADPFLIRPPGSLDEDNFLARCIRCGQCMRVCPNNALHPTFLQAGFEGIWSPILIAKIGYCEPSCTLCGQVCPTGAIIDLTVGEKVGDKETPANRIGTAFIDQGRCLPWAMATPCIVCEEWCPTVPKSIYLADETLLDPAGREVRVKRPYVDARVCTGCGACEFACPVSDRSAIYITSVGESRSEANQILAERRQRSDKPAILDSEPVDNSHR